MAGKGDTPRPVNGDRFRRSFDRIFRGNADRPGSCMDRFNEECRRAGFDPYQDYPKWVCAHCGEKYGRRLPTIASWHIGKCGVCGWECHVTEPRDYGHLDFNQQNKPK